VGLIKTILFILFFYYAFKMVARLLAPFLMRYAAKKVQEKFKDQMHQQRGGFGPQEKPKKEGEVNLKSKKASKEKINTESMGDYVDYEEVE